MIGELTVVGPVCFTNAFDISAKKECVLQLERPPIISPDMPVGLIAITSLRYDASNALDVKLTASGREHFQGTLSDLCRHLLLLGHEIPVDKEGLSLLIRNPYDNDLRCPRLRLEFSLRRATK